MKNSIFSKKLAFLLLGLFVFVGAGYGMESRKSREMDVVGEDVLKEMVFYYCEKCGLFRGVVFKSRYKPYRDTYYCPLDSPAHRDCLDFNFEEMEEFKLTGIPVLVATDACGLREFFTSSFDTKIPEIYIKYKIGEEPLKKIKKVKTVKFNKFMYGSDIDCASDDDFSPESALKRRLKRKNRKKRFGKTFKQESEEEGPGEEMEVKESQKKKKPKKKKRLKKKVRSKYVFSSDDSDFDPEKCAAEWLESDQE